MSPFAFTLTPYVQNKKNTLAPQKKKVTRGIVKGGVVLVNLCVHFDALRKIKKNYISAASLRVSPHLLCEDTCEEEDTYEEEEAGESRAP